MPAELELKGATLQDMRRWHQGQVHDHPQMRVCGGCGTGYVFRSKPINFIAPEALGPMAISSYAFACSCRYAIPMPADAVLIAAVPGAAKVVKY